MKFLPVTEFEKRQKSINRNQTQAIMSSAMAKIGFETFELISSAINSKNQNPK